ncbi:cupin domain-containing protein [Sphingomonas crocodyli]|nr:cupin domain-containing protein [Sphingomonas crocodyli]
MTIDDRALDYVTGALSPQERDTVARDRLSDRQLDTAIRDWETKLAPLADTRESPPAPKGLFDRIAQGVAREREAMAGKTVSPFDEAEWRVLSPGVETRQLWSAQTFMYRCEPGATLPSHVHTDTENLIVISGDCVIGGRALRTGDWYSAPPGTEDLDVRTTAGCVLLVQYTA